MSGNDSDDIDTDTCPMCRGEHFKTFPNKQDERAVLSLRVRCSNTKRGCDWVGELGNIANHLKNKDGCKFEMVHRLNSCGKAIERQYLAGHIDECPCRLVTCQYCHIEGEYQFIEGSHKQECYEFPVPCPNNCESKNIPRGKLKAHTEKVCPLEIVHCQYHNVGCEAKMVRKDLVKHDEEMTNEHLLLMKSALVDTQMKLADSEQQLASTERKLQANYADTEQRFLSTVKKLEANYAEELAKVKMVVQNQISELEATLQQKTKHVIRIHIQAAKLSLRDQLLPVIIKLPDFVKNKNEKVDWYSDPFYTHHKGYKMKLNVVPAGYDSSEGYYMSVYMYIMSGPFDDQLKWRLKGKFQVTLLNQICDSEHHSVSYQNHAKRNQSTAFWYCEEFISYEALDKISATCQYIKDDCLFFEVRQLDA